MHLLCSKQRPITIARKSQLSEQAVSFFFAYYRNRVARDTTRVSREGGNLVLRATVKVKSDEP